MGQEPYIDVRELTVVYGGETIFENENFRIEGSGLTMVIGPNGSGKTTLFKSILGLVSPVKGRVVVNGVDVTGHPEVAGKIIGYVPQLLEINASFPVSVKEVIESAIILHRAPPRLLTPRYLKERILNLLNKLELREVANKPLRELSGGQRQRAFIARAIIWDPSILILDEPLSAVDPKGRIEIVKLIAELAESKLVLVSSHDPSLFLPYAKAIMVVNRGVLAIGSPEEILNLELLKQVYGDSVMLIQECMHLCDSHVR